jgi:1,4-alpha-glucan branching enzyme
MKSIRNAFCLALFGAAAIWAGCSQGVQTSVSQSGGFELTPNGVLFRYYDPDAVKVYVVGDFNNWTPSVDQMIDKNGDGHWTLFYPLAPGRYEYKFVIDGAYWIPDPRNPNTVSDGFEGGNSVLIFPPTQ